MTGQEWLMLPLLLAAAALVRRYVFALVWVKGNSMLPTYRSGDVVAVSRLWGRWGKIPRGRVVLCHYPGRYLDRRRMFRTLFIKRVIGVPGDVLSMEGGQVALNGELLSEPYLDPALCSPSGAFPERALGKAQYFVMGDHRRCSNDSRGVGALDRRMITGVVLFRLFSLGKRLKQ